MNKGDDLFIVEQYILNYYFSFVMLQSLSLCDKLGVSIGLSDILCNRVYKV